MTDELTPIGYTRPNITSDFFEGSWGGRWEPNPHQEAWKALNKTLKVIDLAAFSFPNDGLDWKLDGNPNGYAAQINRFPFAAVSPECSL
jgi:hypothetical protein